MPESGVDVAISDLHAHVESDAFLSTMERAKDRARAGDGWTDLMSAPFDDEAFVVVDKADAVEAMAEFIAASLAKLPQTRNVPARSLQGMLTSAFVDIRGGGTLSRLWSWGSFFYTTYGWTTTAIGIYREPAVAYILLRTIWKAVRWAIIDR
ncbi:Uncharacterized protein PBTT_07224 [Plasmodiophora brassicae]|uniref:Uncharacterized protein n=1 Tax=Plasmodiophora brassicae TaxID=37360 RepID=A0A0G4IXQ7_PLABS|nr:hypothetical protein PBRA_007653 [Plasmodiophora brassicae]SPQ99551.1 unnamed protein product [Plasmodiophora brassicae]